jgi:hypothetical protein
MRLSDRGRLIRALVINHDHFSRCDPGLFESLANTIEARTDAGGFVARRDDHGEIGGFHLS